MNRPGTAPWWRELLRAALQSGPATAGDHVADDDELLACWEADLLSPDEKRAFLDHIAGCADCRLAVVRLSAADPTGRPPAPRPARTVRLGRRGWAAAGMAALVLLAVGGSAWWWLHGGVGGGEETELTRAEADLSAGRAEAAVRRLETWLDADHPPPERDRGLALLERAAYTAAHDDLAAGRFDEVRALADRVGGRGAASARLRNLALQAERDQPTEVALARLGSLLGYGYEMDGSSPTKALPIVDDISEQRERAWRKALDDYPGDPVLLVNYGQWLLSRDQADDAQDCFAAALRTRPDFAEAHLGLGMAAFEQDDDATALPEFEAFTAARPDDLAGHVNAAVCLERLGRPGDARPHWERAAELTGDAKLRQRIERRLHPPGGP